MGTLEIIEQLKLNIKERMKAKGMHIPDLAAEMGVSVSGLRKILARDDISIKTLSQIMELLDSSIEGFFLEKEAQNTHEEFKLTRESDDYLSRDLFGFVLFWLCAIEKRSFKEVAKRLQRKPTELYSSLRKLEDLKILKWKKNDTVASDLKPLIQLPDNSQIRKVVEKCFFALPIFKSVQKIFDPAWKWEVWCLTPEQQQQFSADLEEICLRYARLSSVTIRTRQSAEALSTRFLWRIETFDVVKSAQEGI